MLSPIGFGAFKIGRNQGAKYAQQYDLPDEDQAARLLNGLLDLGINYIDTAPAYGISEERIGRALGHRIDQFVLSTKVGERFENGRSAFDFSGAAIRASVALSRKRLGRDVLDLVFIHSDGNDLDILENTDAVAALRQLKTEGSIKAIGFSGKTVAGATAALDCADALMVEYHLDDRSHEQLIEQAAERGVGVIIKKGLASGRLDAHQAIRFVLGNPHITSMVIGGLNLEHILDNVQAAESI